MKTLATLTLTAAVMFTAIPVHANPAAEAMQQLVTNQLVELKANVSQQASRAVEKTAADLRQLLQTDTDVAKLSDTKAIESADDKPEVE